MPYNRELTIKEELMLAFRDAIIRMPNSEEDNSWRVKRNVDTSEPRFEELLDEILDKYANPTTKTSD